MSVTGATREELTRTLHYADVAGSVMDGAYQELNDNFLHHSKYNTNSLNVANALFPEKQLQVGVEFLRAQVVSLVGVCGNILW